MFSKYSLLFCKSYFLLVFDIGTYFRTVSTRKKYNSLQVSCCKATASTLKPHVGMSKHKPLLNYYTRLPYLNKIKLNISTCTFQKSGTADFCCELSRSCWSSYYQTAHKRNVHKKAVLVNLSEVAFLSPNIVMSDVLFNNK